MNVIDQATTDRYALFNGDSAEVLAVLPDNSVDLAVFSPPFSSLFTYSPSERDLGNCASPDEFWQHFGFISRELVRVLKPGRVCAVHVAQIPMMKERDGQIGIFDFHGDTIRHFQSSGFVYDNSVTIDKDPQVQALRTKAHGLLFAQLRRDAAMSRMGLADYVIKFRAPGANAVPILPDLTNNEWILWARPIWYDIRETDVLQYRDARDSDDERHIAPLQLGTVERCIRLWSNPGETVLSPFAGIGTEVYQAVKLGRKGIGIELKPSYFRIAVKNLERAAATNELPLFADLEVT